MSLARKEKKHFKLLWIFLAAHAEDVGIPSWEKGKGGRHEVPGEDPVSHLPFPLCCSLLEDEVRGLHRILALLLTLGK